MKIKMLIIVALLILTNISAVHIEQKLSIQINEMKIGLDEELRKNIVLTSEIQGMRNSIQKDRQASQIVLGETLFYMSKLGDRNFIDYYGDENEPSIWYIAAEELGRIGKDAVPYLIRNLDTKDTYEKGLTLYALTLATQSEEVSRFSKGDYIEVGLDFLQECQKEAEAVAREWWDKYRKYF